MEPLLNAADLVVDYPSRKVRGKPFRALNSVSLDVMPGEIVGLVGESGSGKTTIGRALLGLVRPQSGSIQFEGMETIGVSRAERRRISRNMQVIFQDPYSSLNPAMTVEDILIEPYMVHGIGSRADAVNKAKRIVDEVGLPASTLRRLPREFSGGQRQRIAIARSIMVDPKLVICDEPVSALDVTTQDQVIDLLVDIQKQSGVSYLFISHDLALVRHLCNRVVVLYRGEVVERGDAETVGARPRHPYTRKLLLAVPVPDPVRQRERRTARLSMLEQEAYDLEQFVP